MKTITAADRRLTMRKREIITALLALTACEPQKQYDCVRTETRIVRTYPFSYMMFGGAYTALALSDGGHLADVCVEWREHQ